MKFKLKKCIAASVAVMAIAAVQSVYVSANAAESGKADIPISDKPLFIGANNLPVLVMLILSRDHSMYTESYTDASDVNGDGEIDYYFKPEINYYGLFRSDVCYKYENDTFVPAVLAEHGKMDKTTTTGKKTGTYNYCNGSYWSGNLLNYVTTSRMDAVKKVLMGGERADLKGDQSIIRHTWIPYDAHSWGKSFVNAYYKTGYSPALTIGNFVPADDLKLGEGSVAFGGAFFGVKNDKLYIGIPSRDSKIKIGNEEHTIEIGNMDEYGSKKTDKERNDYMQSKAWIWNWASRESAGYTWKDLLIIDTNGILEKFADFATPREVYPDTEHQPTREYVEKNYYYEIISKGFKVQVKPCVDDDELTDKAGCRKYTDSNGNVYNMPSGLIQQRIAQGAPDFGLITTGFEDGRNIGHGYVRGKMHDVSEEIDEKGNIRTDTFGQDCNGGYCNVLPTINMLGAGYFNSAVGDAFQWDNCSTWPRRAKFYNIPGETCNMWGNPIGALLKASYDYFSGQNTASITGNAPDNLTRRSEKRASVQQVASIGYARDVSSPWTRYNKECQNGINLVLSSEDNSYDATVMGGHNRDPELVRLLADTITKMELSNEHSMLSQNPDRKFYVGGIYNDNHQWTGGERKWEDIAHLSHVDNLSQVYGIAPIGFESEGNYDAVAAAYKGVMETLPGTHNYLKTSVVAMAPSLPRFRIKNGTRQMEIVPVCFNPADRTDTRSESSEDYIQTCVPVDFYMDWINYNKNGDPIDMSFRISFEDTESGKDYDQDAIIQYRLWFASDNASKAYVSVKGYASDGYDPQHFGFSVAGVKNPGTFIDMAKTTKYENRQRWPWDKTTQYPKEEYKPNFNLSTLYVDNAKNYDGSPVIVRESFNGIKLYQNADFAADGSKALARQEHHYRDGAQVCRSQAEIDKGLIPLIKGSYKDPVKCTPEVIRTFDLDAKLPPVFLEPPVLLAARYGQSKNPDFKSEKKNALTGFYEPSNYFYVSNASTLASQIDKALTEIKKDYSRHVGTSASFSSNDLSGKNVSYYRANFEEAYWTGDLISYQVKNAKVYADEKYINWKAGEVLAGQYPQSKDSKATDRRNIFIEDKDGNLHLFKVCAGGQNTSNSLDCMDDDSYAAIASKLRAAYAFSAGSEAEIDAVTEFVNFTFGDRTLETTEQGENPQAVQDKVAEKGYPATFNGFRNRGKTGSLYGDIQGATPVYGKTASGLGFVVFGGNDGMIHVLSNAKGEELFAIIPHTIAVDGDAGGVSSPIVEYALPGYSHRFMVDGTINVKTYQTGTLEAPKTHVLALGTYGKKFKGGYALDLSSLSAVANNDGTARKVTNAANVQKLLKWEFDSTAPNDYVGCMLRAPQVIVHKTGETTSGLYAVYGNGYNAKGDAEGNTAALIFVDIVNGRFVNNVVAKEVGMDGVTGTGYKNGMSEPLAYDFDNDGFEDYVYAGDLEGDMYRLPVGTGKDIERNGADAVTDADLERIAVSYDAKMRAQSITTRPAVGVNPDGNGGSVYVSWGTGRFLIAEDGLVKDATGNTIDRVTHSLYTVVDDFSDYPQPITRGTDGVAVSETQYDQAASTAAGSDNPGVRKIAFQTNTPKGGTFRGVVVDLKPITDAKGNTTEAEMVVYNPKRVDRSFVVNTTSPTSDPCKSSAEGYQYVLDLYALKNQSQNNDNNNNNGNNNIITQQKKFGGVGTDVVITMKRDGGKVTIGTATNVDSPDSEGKGKNGGKNPDGTDSPDGGELSGLEQNELNSDVYKMTSFQYLLDNETPW